MVTISIKTNFPDVMRQVSQLQREVAEQALARAVNRTLDQGKTRMVKAITSEFAVKASIVRESLRVRGASRRAGVFRIEGWLESPAHRGRSRNLIHFSARQTREGVSVQIRRGAGRKVIKGAFIANRSNSAGGTVFMREGDKRLPIKALQTIGVPQMFNARRIKETVVAVMRDKFPEVFAREVKYYLGRFNARRSS